jgi:hypothetical protein
MAPRGEHSAKPECFLEMIETYFPNLLGGVDHFFAYVVRGETVELSVAPRDYAESVLNAQGLSTHEPWSPLPESKPPPELAAAKARWDAMAEEERARVIEAAIAAADPAAR